VEGYFTGGPNGEIYLSGDTEIQGKLVDGKQLLSDSGGFVDIDNPEAFDGWMEQELAGTVPTIELLIIDGPVALDDGSLRWTVKAVATGDPEPTVEFSCNPS